MIYTGEKSELPAYSYKESRNDTFFSNKIYDVIKRLCVFSSIGALTGGAHGGVVGIGLSASTSGLAAPVIPLCVGIGLVAGTIIGGAFAISSIFKQTFEKEVIKNSTLLDSQNPVPVKVIEPVELIRHGGISNGGNTCFIAAAIQLMKEIPIFNKKINPENRLKQRVNESDSHFALRQNIKEKLFHILQEINSGNSVSSKEINALRNLFINFEPQKNCFSLNSMGDPQEVTELLRKVLDFQVFSAGVLTHKGNTDPRHRNEEIGPLIVDEMGNFNDQLIEPSDYIEINVSLSAEEETPTFWENYPELTISNKKYKLSGVITVAHSHAIAYVENQKKLIKFNDDVVSEIDKIPFIPPRYNEDDMLITTAVVFYKKSESSDDF